MRSFHGFHQPAKIAPSLGWKASSMERLFPLNHRLKPEVFHRLTRTASPRLLYTIAERAQGANSSTVTPLNPVLDRRTNNLNENVEGRVINLN